MTNSKCLLSVSVVICFPCLLACKLTCFLSVSRRGSVFPPVCLSVGKIAANHSSIFNLFHPGVRKEKLLRARLKCAQHIWTATNWLQCVPSPAVVRVIKPAPPPKRFCAEPKWASPKWGSKILPPPKSKLSALAKCSEPRWASLKLNYKQQTEHKKALIKTWVAQPLRKALCNRNKNEWMARK